MKIYKNRILVLTLVLVFALQILAVLPAAAEEKPKIQISYAPVINMQLDGRQTQWAYVPHTTINTPVSFSVDKSGSSHMAWARLAMDDNYVYIHADVVDPAPFNNKEMNWNGDAVEVLIGDDITQHNAYSANDKHYFFTVGGNSANPECKVLNLNLEPVNGAEGKLFIQSFGYTLQGKIPVSDLGWKPVPGKKLRAFFQLGNSDEGPRTDAYVPFSTDPNGNAWMDAGVWVDAEIVDYIDPTIKISYLAGANVKLDGQSKVWENVPGTIVDTAVSFSQDKSKYHHNAEVKMLMDDNYLYVHAVATDHSPFLNNEMNWNGDAVEVLIGDDTSIHSGYTANDRHYFLVMGGGLANPTTKLLNGSMAELKGASTFIKATSKGYIAEAKIPVKDLGWKPAIGKNLRAFYQLGNSDEGTRSDAFVPFKTDPNGNAWMDANVWTNAVIIPYKEIIKITYAPGADVSVNGKSKVWESIPSTTVAVPVSFSADKALGKHNADVKLLMDDYFLYVRAVVKDHAPFINKEMNWNGDAVEILIGDDTTTHSAYSANDRHYFLVLGGGAKTPQAKVLNGSLAEVAGTETYISKTSTGYVAEAKIPVSDLGWKPTYGKKLKAFFQLGNSDKDARSEAYIPFATDMNGNAWMDASVWVDGLVTAPPSSVSISGKKGNSWVWKLTKYDIPADKAELSFTAKVGDKTATLAGSYKATLTSGKKVTNLKLSLVKNSAKKNEKGELRGTLHTGKVAVKPGDIITVTAANADLTASIRDLTMYEADWNYIVAGFCPITPPKVPVPNTFKQLAPGEGVKDLGQFTVFSWERAAYADSYTLTVADNAKFDKPVVKLNVGLVEKFMPDYVFAAGKTYYWKVTASNTSGDKDSANAGGMFTTAAVTSPAEKTDFVQKTQFVENKQGANQWYYQQWDGKDTFMAMDWNTEKKWWQGSATYLLIQDGWAHSDTKLTALRWVAPSAGSVTIKGVAVKDPTFALGGDGVTVRILHNKTVLFQKDLAFDDIKGFSYELKATVAAGDTITYSLDPKTNNSYDAVTISPVIEFIP